MGRLVLPVAVATLAVFAALCAEGAVEVFVKTPTKLYDAQGQVIQEVTAGYPFEADKAQGKWVYGFIKRKGGGRRGFIALDDLYMTDDNRRALNIPITTGKSAEPVLLRYTLKPGERQVYHTEVAMNGLIGVGEGRITQHLVTKSSTQVGFSLLGAGEANGVYDADVSYHKLRLAMEFTRGTGRKVRIEADERKVTALLDGQPIFSGKWEDYKDTEGPDFATLLRTTARIKISSRHEVLDMGELGGMLAKAGMAGGVAGTVDLVYPAQAVRGGDTWEGSFEESVKDPSGSGGRIPIPGKITYTVLERAEYMKRPCVKLLVEMSGGAVDQASGLAVRFTATGTEYIDEERGIPFGADITGTTDMVTQKGSRIVQGKINLTISARYAGTEVK